MSGATFFVQECPVCGRWLQIRLELWGKSVACRHCQGVFVACDPSTSRGPLRDAREAIMERANQLLSPEPSKPRPR